MNIVICLDDNDGMLFNNRRQSRDKIMLKDLLTRVQESGAQLWISPFSEKLLAGSEEMCPFVTVEENFLEQAGVQDFCFVENQPLQPWLEKIDTVTVYRWNRVYPADTYLDLDLSGWQLVSTGEFSGASHERITREVYRK